MAKQEDRIERVTDFRSRHLPSAFLIADKSIVLLGESIATLEAAPTFSLAHIQAMVLAITLCESQIRDCMRLAIDAPFMDIDIENPLIKDIKLDLTLLNSVREHHFTLGDFFALNTSISTIGRFWAGAQLGFPGYDLAHSFATFEEVKAFSPAVTLDEAKSSLAWVFSERNRYVHEFSEVTASHIGTPHDGRIVGALKHVLLLLRFLQSLKMGQYGSSYSEHHPSRGKVGKKLNELSGRIKATVQELDKLLQTAPPVEQLHDPQDIRKSIFALQAAYNELLFRLSSFTYYAMGPGTIVHDFVYAEHLEELQRFEERLLGALKHQRELRNIYSA